MATQPQDAGKPKLELPTAKVMEASFKYSLKHMKPIDLYFYVDSIKGKVSIAEDDGDKIIYKSDEEHTSAILKTLECENCYIVITANTIYIISKNVKQRKANQMALAES